MSKSLRVLVLEDSATDAELNLHELRRAGFDPQWKRVETEADFLAELDPAPDLILADFSLPRFDGLSALQLVRERRLDIPFILISGMMGEDAAVEAMKLGATDYLLKDRIARLGTAVERALEGQRLRAENRQVEAALRESEESFRGSFENVAVGTAQIDLAGRFFRVNDRYCTITGYSRGELLGGMGPLDLDHPEDREADRDRLAAFLRGEVPLYEAEKRYVRKDGGGVWVKVSATVVRGADGTVRYTAGVIEDITERKRAEEAVADLNRRLDHRVRELQTILDVSPVGIAIAEDVECRKIWVNPVLRELLRLPEGANASKSAESDEQPPFRILRDGVEVPTDQLPMQRCIATGRPVLDEEVEIVFPDGSACILLKSVVPLFDEAGKVRGCIAFNMDQTERNRAEAALREKEHFLHRVTDVTPGMLHVFDLEKQCLVFVNRTVTSVLGYGPGELQAMGAELVPTLMHPDDLPRFEEHLRHVSTLGDNEIADFEHRMRDRSGEWHWFHNRNAVFARDSAGCVRQIIGSAIEITVRKQAEQALTQLNASLELQVVERTLAVREREEWLRTILNTAADAIITLDAQGIIQSVNPAAEEMFCYPAAEMIGQNFEILMPSTFGEGHDRHLANYAWSGVANRRGSGREVVAQRKDGSTFPVELAVSEVGQFQMFTVILRDITRRKELEREVVEIASFEQRRIGQDLHDSVGQELTALNILAGDLADTLRTEPANGSKLVERMVQGLHRSQRELRAVLRGLLPVAVDIEGLMASLADLADRIQEEGKATCTFDCPEPVSVVDNLTATHLYLIAQEAVHNAVKHAQPKNILISLEANNLLILSVHDDGIGMLAQPAENHGGLGLRVMQNRAAIIGARLTIQPTEPTGTLVTCALVRNNP